MLDSDIAVYFGVETKALNRAMKRNIKRFPPTFCFQLTYEEISRCQIGTSMQTAGIKGGRTYMPYVYTEQGVAMLTSTLHTDQAIAASIQIMEAFVEMTHYLQESRQMLPYQEMKLLARRQDILEADVKVIKDDLSELIRLFDDGRENEEILILDGQPFKADLAYQKIYKKAKKSIVVIDDYINTKTLYHLSSVKESIKVTIISDNKGKQPLRSSEYNDYLSEYPKMNISFIKSFNKSHDRYIVIDNNTKDMKVYHCGASSKDAGKRITTITQIRDITQYKTMVNTLLKNSVLELR